MVGMAVAVLLLAACGGDAEPLGPTATVPRPTTTTNPYVVPTVIDEAYVNRVLAGLDEVVGDAVRHLERNRLLDEEVYYRLRAVSSDDVFRLKVDGLQDDLLGGMSGYSPNPGNKVTTVIRVISVSHSCIFSEVKKDFTAVNADGQPNLSTQWIALVPLDPTRDPGNYNPTRWMFIYDGFQPDESAPTRNPCAEIS